MGLDSPDSQATHVTQAYYDDWFVNKLKVNAQLDDVNGRVKLLGKIYGSTESTSEVGYNDFL